MPELAGDYMRKRTKRGERKALAERNAVLPISPNVVDQLTSVMSARN
jgi:hypothetical protein